MAKDIIIIRKNVCLNLIRNKNTVKFILIISILIKNKKDTFQIAVLNSSELTIYYPVLFEAALCC